MTFPKNPAVVLVDLLAENWNIKQLSNGILRARHTWQGSREDRTQNEQNLPFLVLSVITYSLQHWLTHRRSIMYPTHTATLTETLFCFATRASHLSETTRSRDVTCWGTFSGSPSWSSFLDHCHKQQQKTCNWRTSGGQLQTVFSRGLYHRRETVGSIFKDMLLREFTNSPKHLLLQINRNGQCTH